jgi:c-di-GMP-binding flagellar brake protein YcgR
MEERRIGKRWILNSYFDVYREDHDSSPSYLADISTGGMLLISKHPVQANMMMPLRIALNDEIASDGELKITTQVVRCRKDENFEYYNTGCKLIDLSNSKLEIIEQMIEMYALK